MYRPTLRLAGLLAAGCCLLGSLPPASAAPVPKASSRALSDGPSGSGPEAWDADGDGVFTCAEWTSYLERWFAVADRNRDGRLDASEFASIRRPNTFFAEADFGYFDENQDGRVTHQEFVDKPSEFILEHDRNSDCRVTPEEMKPGAADSPKAPGGRGKTR